MSTALWVTLDVANLGIQAWIIWGDGAHGLSRISWLHPTWGAEMVKLLAWVALLGGSFWLILGLIDPAIRPLVLAFMTLGTALRSAGV